MEIPNSINTIMSVVGSSDPFNTKPEEATVKIDNIVDTIRHNVPIADYSAVEEGRAYFKKDIQSERNIVKNFLSLYGDTLSKSVLTSAISDDIKPIVQKAILENIKSMQTSLDAIGIITDTLNKQKNILDVKRISFIMLGYAIAIIKKIYNN